MKAIFKSIDKRFGELNKEYEFSTLRECFNNLCKIIASKHYQTEKLYVELLATEINASYIVWLEDITTKGKTPIGFIQIDEKESDTDEQPMKEMIYTSNSDHTEILCEGVYRKHKFCIVSKGGYPCAYVECKLNVNSFSDEKLYDVDVHGGFTYYDDAYWDIDDRLKYLGWDYAHSYDYTVWADGSSNGLIHWTTEQIYNDVKYVINKLIKLEELQ
jgi:hypothetical protein